MLIQDYASYSNPKMKIGRLVKEGKLIPIIQGIYETDKSIPGYYLSGIIYDPSYLSFEFALSWYGLIPETVYNYTSASYSKKKRKNTIHTLVDSHTGMYRQVFIPMVQRLLKRMDMGLSLLPKRRPYVTSYISVHLVPIRKSCVPFYLKTYAQMKILFGMQILI